MTHIKSSTSPFFQQITHGIKYPQRSKSLSMFQLLTWPSNPHPPENPDQQSLQLNYNQQPIEKYPIHHQQKSVYSPCPVYQHNKQNVILNSDHLQAEKFDKWRYQQQPSLEKPKIKPHQIKNELYYYTKSPSNRIKSEPAELEENPSPKIKVIPKTLDVNDPIDAATIKNRNKVVKQFQKTSRELPNSAFTTYYGKPAFQLYGYLSSDNAKRTHNIMPHIMENNPKACQSYKGALLKAKSVDHHHQFMPRKPLEKPYYETERSQKQSNIKLDRLKKPDLINNVRFLSPEEVRIDLSKNSCIQKPAIPSHIVKKRNNCKQKNKRHKKNILKRTMSTDDGLKFMNTRDKLIEQIEDQKIKNGRLPYKVTECYPKGSHRAAIEEYGVTIAAGIRNQPRQCIKGIIYHQY